MRGERRWSILLVPHGSESPRTYSLSQGAVRALVAGGALLVALAALGALATGNEILLRSRRLDQASLRQRVVTLQSRLDSLSDTLEAIGRRDQQIRLLAGLPDSAAAWEASGASAGSAGATGDSAPPALVVPGSGAASTSPAVAGGDVAVGSARSFLGHLAVTGRADVGSLIRRANTLAASFAEVSDTLAHRVEKLARIPSIMPTAGWLSSAFSRSRFHPILHIARPHEGIDVSAPMGAPIVAPADGTVIRVTVETGYGNILEIDHGNGIVTKYAHCSRIVVRQGQHVKRGQVIANVGNTGLSTGPHLHYEIHVNGRVVDPLTYVLPGGAIPE